MARGLLDSFGLSNVAWTIATLQQHTSDADETQHAALLDALAQQACDAAASFKAQEVCNLLWAFATLKRRHLALFQRFAAMATAQMGEMSPHGLSQTFWAYSKLDLSTSALLLAAAQAALRRLDSYDPQSMATLAWAVANAKGEHCQLISALCAAAKRRVAEFGVAAAAQLLWALSRLSDGVDASAARALTAQLAQLCTGAASTTATRFLAPQQLLYALDAVAKLPSASIAPSLPSVLCGAVTAAAPHLTANKLGVAAWALSRPAVVPPLTEAARRGWREALRARALQVHEQLGFRGIGYIEVAMRVLDGGRFDEGDALGLALTASARLAVDAVNSRSIERNAAPVALLRKHAPWAIKSGGGVGSGGQMIARGVRVLVAGFDPDEALDAALRGTGVVPVWWRRFTCGANDEAAAAWPPGEIDVTKEGKEGGFGACLVRWPWYAAGDAAVMAVRAVAAVARADAPLWLCGNIDEGADSAMAVVRELYGDATAVETSGGATLCHARRRKGGSAPTAPDGRSALHGWRAEHTISLPGMAQAAPQQLPWCTYPGLFAGGTVDVMTTALLAALPSPPRGARILDACCGSGTIGAALLAAGKEGGGGGGHHHHDVRVELLDADAVALVAARENVPGAARLLLSDGYAPPPPLSQLQTDGYDWIVSNPPVHRGQPDDFRVVQALVRGARQRLRRGGVLWVVAQGQVPIGRIMASDGHFERIEASVSTDGRFVTWSGHVGGRREDLPPLPRAAVLAAATAPLPPAQKPKLKRKAGQQDQSHPRKRVARRRPYSTLFALSRAGGLLTIG